MITTRTFTHEAIPFDEEQEIQMTRSWAEDVLTSSGEFYPSFIAWSKDQPGRMLFTTPWSDEEDKERMLKMIELTFAVYNVERYMMVSEVWSAPAIKDDKRMPSEREDKKESLAITYVHRKKAKMLSWPIHRNLGGRPELGTKEEMGDGSLEGRMTELLPPEDMPPCPIELRDSMLETLSKRLGLKPHMRHDVKPNKEGWH